MDDDPRPTCASCRFWCKVKYRTDGGECRRHAPVVEAGESTPDWPFTQAAHWCGDFEPRAPQEASDAH